MRRSIRQCADYAKWTLVILMVAVTLLLLAGRFLVNQLSFYQPAIERWLSTTLATPVTAGRVSGEWRGVLPRISLESARIGGEVAFLSMEHMEIEPDYLRSLVHGTLVVREMQISGLRLALHEGADGAWQLGGLSGAARASAEVRAQLWESLTRSRSILLNDTGMDLLFYDGQQVPLSLGQLRVNNVEDFHRFVADIAVGSEHNRISFIAELGPEVAQVEGALGRAHLRLEGGRLDESLTTLMAHFGSVVLVGQPADDTALDAELWFDLFADRRVTFSGQMALQNLALRAQTESPLTLDFRAHLGGAVTFGDQARVDFVEPVLVLNDEALEIFDFRLRQGFGVESQQLSLATERLAIGQAYNQLLGHGLIAGRLREVLEQLNPRGTLSRLQLDFDLQNPANSLQLRGNLEQVDLDAFMRAPSVTNLSGYFEAGARSGFVQIDAEQIGPHYEGVYDQPFLHQRLQGTVGWFFDADRHAVAVYADQLRIRGEQGDIVGAFRVEAPSRPGAFPTDLTLAVGLAGSSAEHWPSLVPNSLPATVRDWLASYMGVAEVPAAGFIYRGLLQGVPLQRTMQLRLAMRDAELGYAEGWPRLQGVDAELQVDNLKIRVTAPRAQMGAIDVSGAEVLIDTNAPARLSINTGFEGLGDPVLDLLRDTPVRNRIGAALDDFDLEGQLAGQVRLDFPLLPSFPLEDLVADIRVGFAGNRLTLNSRNLTLENLSGELHYDQDGLWSDQLTGALWSRPIDLSLSTDERIQIDLQTEVAIADLAGWLQTSWLDSLEGSTTVQGRIEIGRSSGATGRSADYGFQSDLRGIRSDLPPPLDKAAETVRELRVDSRLSAQGSQLAVSLGDQLRVQVGREADGALTGVSLGLNADAPPVVADQINGRISLEDLDVARWTALLASSPAGASDYARLNPHIEIAAQRTRVGSRDLGATHAELWREDNIWNLDFAALWGQGIYRVAAGPGSEQTIPELHLQQLDIAAWQVNAVAGSETDPREIPRLSVSIEQLMHGERQLGAWQFDLQPVDMGVEIVGVTATLGDIRVVGAERASRLLWTYDGRQHSSQLDLSLEFANAAEIFNAFNQPSPVSSSSGSFYSSFAWAGKPDQALDQPLSGVLGLRLQDGEFDTQVEGVGNALMRVIGLFNINSWARRLQFDFSDVTARGTRFDSLRGDFVLDQGVLTTLTPVDARLTSGRMRFDGQVDLINDSVDAQLVATLPLRENMTWVTGLVAGLPAAMGVWLVGKLFEEEVDDLTSVSYLISGDLDDPDVRTERVFESTIGN